MMGTRTFWSRLFAVLGAVCLVAALFWMLFIYRKEKQAQTNLQAVLDTMDTEDTHFSSLMEEDKLSFEAAMAYWPDPNLPMPIKEIDGRACIGTLSLPDLSLTLPIFQENTQDNLERGAVVYAGSLYKRNLVLCGHSYPAIFKRLDQLRYGSVLYLRDMAGNNFGYRLLDTEIIPAEGVQTMLDGDWDVTLYTCTVFNVTRLTCRYELISFIPARMTNNQ